MHHRSPTHAFVAIALLSSGAAIAQSTSGPQPLQRRAFVAQMDAQFGKMDRDRNGLLDKAEIEQFERDKALAEAQARNESLFEALDVNKNGQISAAEFAKLVTAPTAASAQPMLSREDRDRDGQVSMAEHRTATLANFDRLDADRDGVVSVAEMKAGGIAPR